MKNLIIKIKFYLRCLFKKKLSREDLLDRWLLFHNTSTKELIKKHPKEILESPKWFDLYPVTKKQYDEWEAWCKKKLRKYYPKGHVNKSWGWISLDCAPNIKKEIT